MKTIGMLVLLLASASAVFGLTVDAPEIDSNSAVGAVALIAGGVTILRARRGK